MISAAQQNGLAARILEYIQQRRSEKLDKEKNADKRLEITAKYEPKTWLSDAARRARQLSFITHAANTFTETPGAAALRPRMWTA